MTQSTVKRARSTRTVPHGHAGFPRTSLILTPGLRIKIKVGNRSCTLHDATTDMARTCDAYTSISYYRRRYIMCNR